MNELNSAIGVDVQDQLSIVTIDVEEENGEMGIVLKGHNHSPCCK